MNIQYHPPVETEITQSLTKSPCCNRPATVLLPLQNQ